MALQSINLWDYTPDNELPFPFGCTDNYFIFFLYYLIFTSYRYYAAYSFNELLLLIYHTFHNKANHMLNKQLIYLLQS